MNITDEYSPYGEEGAKIYDNYSFIWTLYPPLIKDIVNLDCKQSVLDLGCGSGSLLIEIHNQIGHGTGVDISKSMIMRAIEKISKLGITNLEFDVCNILDVSADKSFDVVLCTDGVLPYLNGTEDLRIVFQNLTKIINVRGIAILEFWTEKVNVQPADGINEIPPGIESITTEMLGESFLCEIKKLSNPVITRFRFYCPNQPYSYTVIRSESGEELHRYYYIRPDTIRDILTDYGFKIVGEFGLTRQNGKPVLTEYNDLSKIWTVLLGI